MKFAYFIKITFASLLLATSAQAQSAANVTFDDSTTTIIHGSDVQETLESVDTEIHSDRITITNGIVGGYIARAAIQAEIDGFHEDIDDASSRVFLRDDCTGYPNCFTTMSALSDPATGWLWNVRKPTNQDRVVIDVGPGTFDPFICPDTVDGKGFVHIRGSGRTISTIQGIDAVEVTNCDGIEFSDILIQGSSVGVLWIGGGHSRWSNVDILIADVASDSFAYPYGWTDICSATQVRGTHYFFGSTVTAIMDVGTTETEQLMTAYYSDCGETWFYGGEVSALVRGGSGLSNELRAIHLGANKVVADGEAGGDFRAFGTAVRSIAQGPTTGGPGYRIIGVTLDGCDPGTGAPGIPCGDSRLPVFHMHGGIINASADGSGPETHDVTGLRVGPLSFAHTPGTAYVIRPSGSGTAQRLLATENTLQGDPGFGNKGVAAAPFLWPGSTVPPASASEVSALISANAQDLFVESDCASNGDCNASAGGVEPHLMVYSPAACPNQNWFDVVTGRCRNDTTP